VTGSATFVADPAVRLEKWGYSFTDDYQFSDDSTGTVVDQTETATDRSTETGHYSYSLSSTSTMTFGGGGSSSGSSTLGLGDSGSDRTTEYAAGNNSYTTTETANFSQWMAGTATLSRTSMTANYSGNGGDTATTYQHGEKTHTSTSADPTNSTNSYSYTGSDTGTYAYSGGSSVLNEGPTSTYYVADSVAETVDAGFSWRKGGVTFGNQETASFTIIETGSAHSRDQMFPTVTQSGTTSGELTPYTGTAWGDGSSNYSLTLTPDSTSYPTSVSASYWQFETNTNTATYSGTVAAGSFGDTQVHRDQETNWLSTSYTTSEHGSPAPDDPNPPTGTATGSSTSSSSSVPSTYTLTATGSGFVQTVRSDSELWSGATAATLVTNSLTVQVTGDGSASSTLTERFGAMRAWSSPLGINQSINNGAAGSVVGANSRTVTEGNAYTLTAGQTYVMNGTAVASGSDTYSLYSSDTTVVHDAFAGSASPDVSGQFNATWEAAFAADPSTYTATLTQAADNRYAAARTVTSGLTWASGKPTGVAVDRQDQQSSHTASLTLVAGDANSVTQGTVVRAVQHATLTTAEEDTQTGTLAVTTTHTTSPSGSATAYTVSTSSANAWGFGTATLHADEYRQTATSAGTNAESRLTDKYASDTHSVTGSWQSGTGGTVTATARGTVSAVQQAWNRVHYDPTFSSSQSVSSYADTTTDARTTYRLPATLSSGGTNGWYVDQTLATALETASGVETESSFTLGGSGTHTHFSTQSFTIASTYAPATFTATTRWVTGNDLLAATWDYTHSTSAASAGSFDHFEKRQTSTHDFTLTHTHHISGSAHTQWINNRDYQSATDWTAASSTTWGTAGNRMDQHTAAHQYTASLFEAGQVSAAVTTTLHTLDALHVTVRGTVAETSANASFTHTVDSTDALQATFTPLGGGTSRTVSTSAHVSRDELHASYNPTGAATRRTDSTLYQNHLETVTEVGSVVENLTAWRREALDFLSNKYWRTYDTIGHTSIWSEGGGGISVSVTVLKEDTETQLEDLGIDPLWLVQIGSAMEAVIDVVLGSIHALLELRKVAILGPSHAFHLVGQQILSLIQFGKSLYGAATGTDPETGRILTSREHAELIGSVLGTIVGLVVMNFAGRAVGATGGAVARHVGRFYHGETCSLNPFKSCFVAGTPLRTPDGSKPIEEVRSYEDHGDGCDVIWSRSEFDPAGPVVARRVLRQFVRVSPVLNLHVGGRLIGTTAEHPFYLVGQGWVPAAELRIGDWVVAERGDPVRVDGIADSGRVETVYNLEVEDDHTYFVGEESWGFAVWAHNRPYEVGPAKDLRKRSEKGTEVNHAPQSREAELLVGGFDRTNKVGNEPAIRLPTSEHQAVTAAQAARPAMASARDLLASDIRILRNHTRASNSALRELINLNRKLHPTDYAPLHRRF
jgi:hypothetical protein